MTDSRPPRPDVAGLTVLIVLQAVMLGALFTGTPPHPPQAVALFALGPFLAASLALAAAAIPLGGTRTRAGAVCTLVAVLLALVSYGPQKWADGAIGLIWPAVLLAQLAAGLLLFLSVRGLVTRIRS